MDAHLCSDPGKFISALLTSLSTMVQIELPHVNVLSKIDLMQQYGKLGQYSLLTKAVIYFFFLLAFGLDYYTEVLDLNYMLEHLSDDPFFKKYKALNQALIEVVEGASLVSFIPLNVQVIIISIGILSKEALSPFSTSRNIHNNNRCNSDINFCTRVHLWC